MKPRWLAALARTLRGPSGEDARGALDHSPSSCGARHKPAASASMGVVLCVRAAADAGCDGRSGSGAIADEFEGGSILPFRLGSSRARGAAGLKALGALRQLPGTWVGDGLRVSSHPAGVGEPGALG